MSGVSVAVGVVALVCAGLLATVGNMQWPRLIVALVLTGVAGIINGSFGPMIHAAVTKADQAVSGTVGRFTGAGVTGLLALVLFVVLALRLWHNNVDLQTLGIAAAVPPTVTMIPGTLGALAIGLVGIVPSVVGSVIRFAFGIG